MERTYRDNSFDINDAKFTREEALALWEYFKNEKNEKKVSKLCAPIELARLVQIPDDVAVNAIIVASCDINQMPCDATKCRCIDGASNVKTTDLVGYASPNNCQNAIHRVLIRIIGEIVRSGAEYLSITPSDPIEYLHLPGEHRLRSAGIDYIRNLQDAMAKSGWYITIQGLGIRRATAIRRRMIDLGLNPLIY